MSTGDTWDYGLSHLLRVWCWLAGHADVRVAAVGVQPRPGGILPVLDGFTVYEPSADGQHLGCRRCGRVARAVRH